jgi:hypothetical protein
MQCYVPIDLADPAPQTVEFPEDLPFQAAEES